ncbi:hypothetical protein HPB50_025673 [Hyalomma asiaticum]|uniref:Uncharacterized protein n=1 Tax=Hyalomma asiaticum TaxID=266040 RepID=A0ACB7SAF9_HYAAI|nr:hypothetical protein HPB50_025673 [Hyalomma asiaticum]
MANGADPGPLRAMSPGYRTSGSTSVAPGVSTSRRALFVGSALAAASLVMFIAITVISVYLAHRHQRSRKPTDAGGRSFCCADEFEKIARYVNMSLDPCDDFFSYVCSNAIKYAVSENAVVRSELHRAVTTGVMPENAPMRQAGQFLRLYYKTCVETISKRHSFAFAVGNAFLRNEAHLLRDVDHRKAMTFIMVSALKYRLRSCIALSYKLGRTLRMEIDTICNQERRFLDYLNATVEALRENGDALATTGRTHVVASLLCDKFRKVTQGVTTYYPKNLDMFDLQVWNVEDLEAGLSEHGFKLQDVANIIVLGVGEIRVLYNFFSQEGGSSTKAAYLLWHTIVSGLEEFSVDDSTYSPQVFSICTNSLHKMPELWSLFQAEVLTNHEKDMTARHVFATIKDAVHGRLVNGTLIEAEDIDMVHSFFRNVTLWTPMSASNASVPVPKASADFADNLLRGRAYDVGANIARVSSIRARNTNSYRDVLLINHRYLLLSSFTYNFVFPGSTNFHLLNMAVLGQLFAEILWVLTFYAIPWQQKTASNLRNFTACFNKVYLKNSIDFLWESSVLFTALGLSTVVKAVNLSDWHTVKPAWSLWRLSHAQFFYIFGSYQHCPKDSTPEDKLTINVPLMYVEDFAMAFKCSSHAPMTMKQQCLT